MTQPQGAKRRHFGPCWPEVRGYGEQPHQANFKCVPTLELLAVCENRFARLVWRLLKSRNSCARHPFYAVIPML